MPPPRLLLVTIQGFLALSPGALSGFQFTDVSSSAGIIHPFDQAPTHYISMAREYATLIGGAVAEDFDGDGWVDLFVLSGGLSPNILYRNQGNGTFLEEAALRGLDQTGRYAGVCAADYDSDGDIDLFITSVDGPHLLLTNDGNGIFTANPQAIPRVSDFTTSPSWADIDGDGLLDLALGAWSSESDGAVKIYRNRGDAGFTLFQTIPTKWTFVPHFADLNGDGHVDLVVVADFGNTRFFRNDGRGIFLPAGGSDIQNGMGIATSDLDHDGHLDLFISAIQHPVPHLNTTLTNGNRLLRNRGNWKFADLTSSAGVRAGYWGWGTTFADFDLDGDDDLSLVNGFNAFHTAQIPFTNTPALLFKNQGNLQFTEVGASSGDAADQGQGRCVIAFDYDHDGDLDLFILNSNEVTPTANGSSVTTEPGKLVLLRNDQPSGGNWLKVQIDGRAPLHAHGMGARIEAKLPSKTLMREIHASSNFNGHGPYRIVHFGAGEATHFEVVRAKFPNQDTVEIFDVPVNQNTTIESPHSFPSNRAVPLGETISFETPADKVPLNSEVVWQHEGAEFANPATILFETPGAHAVIVEIFHDSSRSELLRRETFTVEVSDPETLELSIARIWNEAALDAIRIDFPNPAVHARNLFHLSVALWDGWSAYDEVAVGYLHREKFNSAHPDQDRRETMSYAAYRLLSSRYQRAVHSSASQLRLDFLMRDLGFPIDVIETDGNTPAALGNRIAATLISWGQSDDSLEENNYHNPEYRPANLPLVLANSGTTLANPNRWQPLQFEVALSQNGLFTHRTQIYAGSQWGRVRPFALKESLPTYLDPGTPPLYGGDQSDRYREETLEVIRYSSLLDPDQSIDIDISPKSRGLNSLGFNDGSGHGSAPNPATGVPYQEQWVKEADYGRVIAEYWADGPDSETPPGHWNTIANEVSDDPVLAKRFRGLGATLDRLEWDVKLYLALNSALHDAAVAAWACKRYYDYIRPISSIRYLSALGDLPEEPGLVEKITSSSSAPGARHADLVNQGAAVGETAIFVWGGEPANPDDQYSGNQWIRGVDWLPFQRQTFVTPAFAGYVSGHSTFSRAAAEVLTQFTGSPYFPGGIKTRFIPVGSLEFEFGPSSDLTLQWATYFDAADEAGLSRLYGGIHFPVDDGPGRIMGAAAGISALLLAEKYFNGTIGQQPAHLSLVQKNNLLYLETDLVRGFYFQLQQSSELDHWPSTTPPMRIFNPNLMIPITSPLPSSFFRILQKENP